LARAPNVPGDVRAADRQLPERVVDRADGRPSADVGRLELQLRREPAHDRVDRCEVEPFGQQRPDEVTRVERPLAHERLGIDHEPGFPLGGEHVPQMEVPVGQHGLTGRAREVAAQIDHRSKESRVERPILSIEPPRELVRQTRREIWDARERIAVLNRSPQMPQERARDPDCFAAIGVVCERGPWLQPFEQECPPSGFGVD